VDTFKGTPGPWEYSHRNWKGQASERVWFVTGDHHDDEDGEPVCTAVCVVERNETSWPVCEANARLIAAAPALLAACESVVEALRGPLPVDSANIVALLEGAIRAAQEGR
jgi:hypothetical protein